MEFAKSEEMHLKKKSLHQCLLYYFVTKQKCTRQAMYIQRNIMARSRNHSYSGNTTMHSVGRAELNVTVSCVKIQSDAQECFHGKFISLYTIKQTYVFR